MSVRRHIECPVVTPGRHSYTQGELAAALRSRLVDLEDSETMRKMVGFIYEHSGIETRHVELSLDQIAGRRDWYLLVNEATLSLATRSIEALVSETLPIESFDALVVVSASYAGFPALSRRLQDGLGLRPEAICYDLTGLGCAGPTHGLHLADMLIVTGAAKRVCVVCADTMGTHGEARVHNEVPTVSQLVAHCLASDGGAAIVVSDAPSSERSVSWDSCELHTKLWRGSLGENDFTASADNQPLLSVGKEIRTRIVPELGPLMESVDPRHCYFHPGGAALMRKLSASYPSFTPTLDISTKVLREHGNIGAASVLFVLEAAWKAGREFDDQLRLIALGPGIVATQIHFGGVQSHHGGGAS